MQIIHEGSAKIMISDEKKISKKLEVFYNPVMKLNRDVSVLLLKSVPDTDMQIAEIMAGSGIRGLRFLKELEPKKIKNISLNDYKTKEYIKENLKLNGVEDEKVYVFSEDANKFIIESKGFDYIDIDPFGSPNPFLQNAIVRLSRTGILAVTATDTSALSGSRKEACLRKYWAMPMKNELMHEIGLRILIRKVQLIGSENEKALTPIFSMSKDHYYRLFFRCEKGRQKVDRLLESHMYFLYNKDTLEMKTSEYNYEKGFIYAGPLWAGKLWDEKICAKMLENCNPEDKQTYEIVKTISEESKINSIGFYDLNKLSKIRKIPMPKVETVLGKDNSRTHFLGWGIRSARLPF